MKGDIEKAQAVGTDPAQSGHIDIQEAIGSLGNVYWQAVSLLERVTGNASPRPEEENTDCLPLSVMLGCSAVNIREKRDKIDVVLREIEDALF